MRIDQLLEFVDEDFKQMSQQATNIQQGKGAATDAQLRQQRIQQLAANQKARNAAPAGRQLTAPAQATGTAVAPVEQPATNATVTPVQQAPQQTQQQTQPQSMTGDPTLDQNLPGQEPPKKTFAQKVGGLAKGAGAIAGGVAGIGRALKKGYAAGANAVGGPGYAQPAGGGGQMAYSGGAGGGSQASGDAEIADLKSRLSAIERTVGLAR